MKKLLIGLLLIVTPMTLAVLSWAVPCAVGILLVFLLFSGPSSLLPGELVKLALLTLLLPTMVGFFLGELLIGL